jgi:hypothetical protein
MSFKSVVTSDNVHSTTAVSDAGTMAWHCVCASSNKRLMQPRRA